MARIQQIRQQHYLETQFAPVSSKQVTGFSGSAEGVPKFHPLKSSFPAFKAGNLIHMARIKKFRMPGVSSMKMKLPGFKSAGFKF